MSVLTSLVKAYDRLPDAPPYGFSAEKIGFLVSLNSDGSVAHVIDLRAGSGRKRQPRQLLVPQPVKRTAGIAPNFLWDKTSYVLGITASEGKRTADEHAAFVARHLEALEGTEDEGLKAFRLFLQSWNPEQFSLPLWPEEMKDQNVVFALESERRRDIRIHDRPAACDLWRSLSGANVREAKICLVSGSPGPVARLHPSIKGVWGAQSSGAALVSFNLDAFTSYGHEQGDNAPVSEASAFAYTTVLNRFLARDSRHRVQIGDASTVFWATSPDDGEAAEAAAEEAESLFAQFVSAADDAAVHTDTIGDHLKRIRNGEPLENIEPKLAKGVRFNVLGLAPNAARLSVRFHYEDDFGMLTKHYQRYLADMRIVPPPREPYAGLWRYLSELAVQRKRENVPPNLAGEWMRAILTGAPYPLTLLSTTLMRIRADGDISAYRVSMLKAVLVRNFPKKEKEAPVALDPTNQNRGYLLGRLFATYEQIQRAALGKNVNATIKDKFYGSASAQPRKVFPILDSGSANHLSKLGKLKPGWRVNLERTVGDIMGQMKPGNDPFPTSLPPEDQALFGLGYYHQRNEFFSKTGDATETAAESAEAAQ
ncbi:type I-C CRISPR-associated protein Cas8c/Csd1 [Pseudochelatococcus contaminans]|uniref:CRISPR-associated protein Csd1 n=1 Tax=Pseudochelatococcus contaminans TaxID=1538103 RepID=A0A7W5Z6Z6_9HYPH|nr:type I-C CRISPR-associated protein Cas8c/Csd1 [Pseudochelatococcus contaminans]MBB3810661.1 CRISPR-associated protein Csd1 [Pseudochelatococcus contaminans]